MDPEANLAEQESILTALRAATPDEVRAMRIRGERERLRELRDALLDWLNAGGFEPDWLKYPQAADFYEQRARNGQWILKYQESGK